MNHLTDQEMQACASSDDRLQAAKQHLADCADCRAQLLVYRHVCRALANPPAFALPANFAKHVSEQVGLSAAVSRDRFEVFVLSAALITGAVAAAYFAGVGLLARLVSALRDATALTIPWNDLIGQIFESTDPERLRIFALAIAVLIIMAAFDRFILQTLQRKA